LAPHLETPTDIATENVKKIRPGHSCAIAKNSRRSVALWPRDLFPDKKREKYNSICRIKNSRLSHQLTAISHAENSKNKREKMMMFSSTSLTCRLLQTVLSPFMIFAIYNV